MRTEEGAAEGVGRKGDSRGSRNVCRYATVRRKSTTSQDTWNTCPEERLSTSDENRSLPKESEGKKSSIGKSQNNGPRGENI